MKLISRLILLFLVFLIALFIGTSTTNAQDIEVFVVPPVPDENTPSVEITFSGLTSGNDYLLCSEEGGAGALRCFGNKRIVPAVGNKVSIVACATSNDELKFEPDCGDADYFHARGSSDRYKLYLMETDADGVERPIKEASFDVIHVNPDPPSFSTTSPTPDDEITVTLTGPLKRPSNTAHHDNHCDRNDYEIIIRDSDDDQLHNQKVTLSPDCSEEFQTSTFPKLLAGSYILEINDCCANSHHVYSQTPFTVAIEGGTVGETITDPEGEDGLEGGPPTQGRNPCAGGTCPTALGPIPTDIAGFSTKFLSIAIGIAGGIALVLMVIGSIRVLMSSGDPKNLGAGRDMIIAAVAGLLFLIFSVLILRFIGLQILGGII